MFVIGHELSCKAPSNRPAGDKNYIRTALCHYIHVVEFLESGKLCIHFSCGRNDTMDLTYSADEFPNCDCFNKMRRNLEELKSCNLSDADKVDMMWFQPPGLLGGPGYRMAQQRFNDELTGFTTLTGLT